MNHRMTNRSIFGYRAHVTSWVALAVSLILVALAARIPAPSLRAADENSGPSLLSQTQEAADKKSSGCISCHTQTDQPTMHASGTVRLGCTDCHGGNAEARIAAGTAPSSPEYIQTKRLAHPQPSDAKLADRSANPERLYTAWLKESAEYVRFVNPGDLRVAAETCGSAGCHAAEVRNVSTSMMTTGGMLWGAALYNNGAYPHKDTRFGESYSHRRRAAGGSNDSAAQPRGNPCQRRAAGNHSARALGDFAAGKCLARVRTRRRTERRSRRAGSKR